MIISTHALKVQLEFVCVGLMSSYCPICSLSSLRSNVGKSLLPWAQCVDAKFQA